MIIQYDLVRDDNLKPYLKSIKDIDEDDKDQYDEEKTIALLNRYWGLKDSIAEHNFAVAYSDMETILGIYCISVGDYKSCDIHHRELAIFLALIGAVSFRVFHNHPNNELVVTDADKGAAATFKIFADILGMEFKGSFIVAKIGWKCTEDEDFICNEYEEE